MGEINGERGAYTYANGSIHGSSKVWKLVLTGGPCGGKTTAQVFSAAVLRSQNYFISAVTFSLFWLRIQLNFQPYIVTL